MLVEWRFKKPHCHKKEPSSYQLGCFSSIYSLGRCASHSIPFKVKYIFLILLECPSLHLHISPMSFHPSWPTFRPRVRSKYLHRISDTTLLHASNCWGVSILYLICQEVKVIAKTYFSIHLSSYPTWTA